MRFDLIQQVLAMHELDMACRRAFGCSSAELRERALVATALIAWAEVIRILVYPCISPSGRTDGHFAFIERGSEGVMVCSFCKKPQTEQGAGGKPSEHETRNR